MLREANVSRNHNIVETKFIVALGQMSARLFGLIQQDPIRGAQVSSSRPGGRRHAAWFKGQLWGSVLSEELGVFRIDLPFKAHLLKVSHGLPITAIHISSGKFAQQTNGIRQIVRDSIHGNGQVVFVEFEDDLRLTVQVYFDFFLKIVGDVLLDRNGVAKLTTKGKREFAVGVFRAVNVELFSLNSTTVSPTRKAPDSM